MARMGMRNRDCFSRVVGSSSYNNAEDVVIVSFSIFKTLKNNRCNGVGT
jgi:hypothetical protein